MSEVELIKEIIGTKIEDVSTEIQTVKANKCFEMVKYLRGQKDVLISILKQIDELQFDIQ